MKRLKRGIMQVVEYHSAMKGDKILLRNMDEGRKHSAEWIKPDIRGHVVQDCICMKRLEETNPQPQKAGSGLPGAGEEGNGGCLMGTGFLSAPGDQKVLALDRICVNMLDATLAWLQWSVLC